MPAVHDHRHWRALVIVRLAGLVGSSARWRVAPKAAPRLGVAAILGSSFLAGSVPFSQLAARHFAGADLRRVGTGTVSGTALYQVAGFGPLAAAGVLDVAKGAIGPLLAGRDRPALASAATAAAIAGHNWSPWLRGAGGRGLSPALGATLALAPEGTALLGAGMAGGRLLRSSGLVTFLCALGLVPLLGVRRGRRGAGVAVAVLAPMIVKRAMGNRAPERASEGTGAVGAAGSPAVAGSGHRETAPGGRLRRWEVLRSRLLYDRDAPPVAKSAI